MAEKQSIKRFIVRDPHGHIEQEDSFSVVGKVHVNLVPGYGEPYADSEYVNGTLTITIHNIEGNGITEITTDSQEGDEAVNTVTIKTNANPEGVTLEVRNGSRGNGIASISEVLSPEDGGTNTHTFTDDDGNEHVFHTKNGQTGRKGDQGDSAVYNPDDPSAPDFVMANNTGQSTTKAMTQKAVTAALMNSPKSFAVVGEGASNAVTTVFSLKPNHTYKLSLDKTTWDVAISSGSSIFSIGKYVNDTWTSIYNVTKGNAAQSEYIINVDSTSLRHTVTAKADVGESIGVTVEDITSIYSGLETHVVGNSFVDTYNQSNGFRFYVRLNKQMTPPFTLRFKGTMPTGVQWGFQGFDTLANMQGTSTNPKEGYGYVDDVRDYTFKTSQYLRLAFKVSSGNLTSAQMTSISQNVVLETFSAGNEIVVPLIDSEGNKITPLTDSKSVMHDNKSLKEYLDVSAFYKEFAIDEMAGSSPISARRRYTAKVPLIPCIASIEGNIPNGFLCGLASNNTLADAQSADVNPVQATAWGVTSYQFTAENAYYITIAWKKADASNFTADDIATIEESDIKLVVKNFETPSDESNDIISLNDKEKTLVYLRNGKRSLYSGYQYTPLTPPLSLLHFSDIHADGPNLTRIVQFLDYYKTYIDDAIHTGDMIKNLFGDSYAFWDGAGAGGILNCTGNHEYYNGESSDYYRVITQKQVYDKFFAPYIEDWGVTQPDGADEDGLNYYYKDYTTNKVRLVVLDNFRVDDAQLAWFEAVLADAITKGLHVIAAMHVGDTYEDAYDCTFTALLPSTRGTAGEWVMLDSEKLFQKVDEFINNNGNFIGWIGGHRHFDTIGVLTYHPNQLSIHVATGSCGTAWDIIPKADNCDRTPGGKSQDCFNIYSIDTHKKRIKIHRIGCDVDRDFRHKGNLLYDYGTHQVIYVD